MEHVFQNLNKARCNPLRVLLIIAIMLAIMLAARGAIWANDIAPLATTPAWTAEGGKVDTKFGWSVASAGDVNGDGYDDVIVGAPFYTYTKGGTEYKSAGKVFVFYGSANGLSGTPAWTMECDMSWAQFGYSVSSAGDVNGDGFADVIISAPNYNDDKKGRVFVYLGSATGLSATSDWSVEGEQAGALFGHSVSKAGDLNGDGYDDVIVGSPYGDLYPTANPIGGKVFVYLGSSSGLATTPAWIAECSQATALFGFSVAAAGDVNHDGYDDVFIGAPYYDHDQANEGQAYLYLGKATQTPNDTPLSSTPAWTIEGDQADALLGFSVASAGDVNRDGFLDAIVGVPFYGTPGADQGEARLYLGSISGLSTAANWTASGGGDSYYVLFGWSVAPAGDLNKDGYDDIIIGAPYYSVGQTYEGQASVYLGSATGLSTTPSWSIEGNQDQAILGNSVASAGDVNRDGAADVVIGVPGYNNNGLKNWGRALLFTGILTNSPPVANDDHYATDEDTLLTIAAPGVLGNDTDVDGDTLMVTDVVTQGTQGSVSLNADGSFTYIPPANFYGDDSFAYSVGDGHGGEAAATVTITVTPVNDSPIITAVSVPCVPIKAPGAIDASAAFTDIDGGGSYQAIWDWGDGSTSSGIVTGPSATNAGTVTGSHEYTLAGVYKIKLELIDGSLTVEAVSQCYVVVYDPSAGFVTGGGWINSPAGAYKPVPTMAGKATFGFVSRYQKGATTPTGQTEFQFQAGSLNFHSTSYQWLTVAGAKAMYKGEGTINGGGKYGFILSAIDGDLLGQGKPDMFRIKIWNVASGAIVYDNQNSADAVYDEQISANYDNPTTVIAGGSIIIHN